MGLNASVFRNRKHLKLGSDAEHAKLDPKTGEVYFEDPKIEKRHFGELEALSYRLGNIAAIAALQAEASSLIGPESFVVTKILYNGVHCGDVIAVRELPELSAELSRLSAMEKKSPLLQEFIGDIENLIRAAEAEENPIVF